MVNYKVGQIWQSVHGDTFVLSAYGLGDWSIIYDDGTVEDLAAIPEYDLDTFFYFDHLVTDKYNTWQEAANSKEFKGEY